MRTRIIIATLLIVLCVYGTTMLLRNIVQPDVSTGKCVIGAIGIVFMLINMLVYGAKVKEE